MDDANAAEARETMREAVATYLRAAKALADDEFLSDFFLVAIGEPLEPTEERHSRVCMVASRDSMPMYIAKGILISGLDILVSEE